MGTQGNGDEMGLNVEGALDPLPHEGARACLAILKSHDAALRAIEVQKGDNPKQKLALDLLESISSLDAQKAKRAWDQGGRLDDLGWTAQIKGALSSANYAAIAFSKSAAAGKREQALALLRWMDSKGLMLSARSRSEEQAAIRASESGNEEFLQKARSASLSYWPKYFEAQSPDGAARFDILTEWAAGWNLPKELRQKVGERFMKTFSPRFGTHGPGNQPWIIWALKLGANPTAEHWSGWIAHEGLDFARKALEQTAGKVEPRVLEIAAACAALLGNAPLLAQAARMMPQWDWRVASDCLDGTQQWSRIGSITRPEQGWSVPARIPLLVLAAIGRKTSHDGNKVDGILFDALADIPEARAAVLGAPCPMGLSLLTAGEFALAAAKVPELASSDSKGRTVAHAWATAGRSVKRIQKMMHTPYGHLLGQADLLGVTPLSMLKRSSSAHNFDELWAKWESGSLDQSVSGAFDDEEPEGREAQVPRGPRL